MHKTFLYEGRYFVATVYSDGDDRYPTPKNSCEVLRELSIKILSHQYMSERTIRHALYRPGERREPRFTGNLFDADFPIRVERGEHFVGVTRKSIHELMHCDMFTFVLQDSTGAFRELNVFEEHDLLI